MKKLIFSLLFCFIINSCTTRGQLKDFDDTIFFIVDKNAKYVTYKEGKVKGDFEIEIKCNYYKETENIYDDEYAQIHFYFEQNEETVQGEIILIDKVELNKVQVADTEWVAKQESREAMSKKVPWDWWWKRGPHFVIFKEDLLSKNKKIKAYSVSCGEAEIEW